MSYLENEPEDYAFAPCDEDDETEEDCGPTWILIATLAVLVAAVAGWVFL